MLDYFQRLFAYNRWANTAVIHALRGLPEKPPRAVELLGHLLHTELFAQEVVNGADASYLYDAADPPFRECEILADQIATGWLRYLGESTSDELAMFVSFRNSQGDKVTRRVSDLLTHAVNHSTYHRGQIASQIRAAGGEPAKTDFMLFTAQQK